MFGSIVYSMMSCKLILLKNMVLLTKHACNYGIIMYIWTVLFDNSYLLEQSYNPEAYEELMEFLSRHSLSDGDKFCSDLMRESSRHKGLGMPLISQNVSFKYELLCNENITRPPIPIISRYHLLGFLLTGLLILHL